MTRIVEVDEDHAVMWVSVTMKMHQIVREQQSENARSFWT